MTGEHVDTAGQIEQAPRTHDALVLERVSHWYGDVVAVNDISFAVSAGITGLLGPNGAGKSTLLQLAAGVMTPSSGRVLVHGETASGGPAIYRQVALVPERESVPGTMAARAFVRARADMLGVRNAREAVEQALQQMELDTVASRRIDTFSKGMKQRIKLAAAMVHAPSLVLLDEPFNGLDPRQRLQMMRLLQERAAEGTSIVLSSHILEEIAGVASRILVVLAGRLAASGDYRTLRRLMTDRPHTMRLRSSDDRALAAALVREPYVLGVESASGFGTSGFTVRTSDALQLSHRIARVAQEVACTLYEVQVTDESLEHVFQYLVAK